MTESAFSVAFFASGRGSNFQSVFARMQTGDVPARTSFVLSNNSGSNALAFAGEHGIPAYHVSSKSEGSPAGEEKKILALLDMHNPKLLVLAGYMKTVPAAVIRKLPNRIINIHPALLPAFGGKGWYGSNVHEGVVKKGCLYTGVTVHLVNEVYDEGAIILQRVVSVLPDESPEALARAVLKVEHDTLWRVVAAFATGRLQPGPQGLRGLSGFKEENLQMLGRP